MTRNLPGRHATPPAIRTRDLLLRRTWAVVPRPVHTQVSGHAELSASDCHYPWLSASSGTQRARDLLIRRYLCGHPDPSSSARDLGRVPARCSRQSGEPECRPSASLPAWLPAAHDTGHRDALVLVTDIGPSTGEGTAPCPDPAVCQPEKRKVDSSILSLTTSFGLASSALTSTNTD
jgi:hypothetical protein